MVSRIHDSLRKELSCLSLIKKENSSTFFSSFGLYGSPRDSSRALKKAKNFKYSFLELEKD